MTCITVNELPFQINDVTPAESRVSRIVGLKIRILDERSYRTATRLPRKIVLDELSRIYNSCHQSNWDGYGALPVTINTIMAAKNFFGLFLDSIHVPDVTADPDGDVAFEWNENDSSLTVAVNSAGHVAYAAYYGDNATTHGSEDTSDSAVETIRRLIDRVYRDKNPR